MSVANSAAVALSRGLQHYRYDGVGMLAGKSDVDRDSWCFWHAGDVVNEVRRRAAETWWLTWLRGGDLPVAEIVQGQGGRTSLLAASISGSVVIEADHEARPVVYTPYGDRGGNDTTAGQVAFGFNGEMLDATSGYYLLGPEHHRPYHPALGMFLAPDRASPFGSGGLNTLAYCAGDPINRTDPSGHFWKWVIGAVAVVIGIAAVVATAGAAATAIGGIAAGLGVSKSGAAAIAATTLGVAGVAAESGSLVAHATGNENAGNILGWVGLGLGVAGMASAVAPVVAKAVAKGVGKAAGKISRFTERIRTIRTQGLSGRGAPKAAAQWANETGSSGRSVMSSLSDETAMTYFKSAEAMHEAGRKGLRMGQLTPNGKQSVRIRIAQDTGFGTDDIPADWQRVRGGYKSKETGEMVYRYDFHQPSPNNLRPGLTADEVAAGMTAPHNVDTLPYARAGRVDARVQELTRDIRRTRISEPVKPRHLSSRPY